MGYASAKPFYTASLAYPCRSQADGAAYRPGAYETIACDWCALSSQLMEQWHDLTREELENTHRNRHAIAELIERKEGISAPLVENYLHNLERTLPIFQ